MSYEHYERYQERLAEAMDPAYWRRRNDPTAPSMKAHAAALVRQADLVLAALYADGWTPPRELLGWAYCGHHDDVDELHGDEHLAGCLGDVRAGARLARREGQWDSHGVSGYEL